MSIQPLPEDVVAQIKSSTTITSLNGVIFELMQNSLDAGSTKVDISVDYSRGGCVVEDDGLGILPSEFEEEGGLGKLYHSSKLNSQARVHGGRGTFLASLSAMSLLSITSHHHLHRSHNTLSMHKSEVISRQMPAPALQCLSTFDHGTRVTVRNLFGNMPVRVKQRAIISEKQGATNKEWESLKSNLVLLLLAWPSAVGLTLRELATNQKMIIRGPSKFEKSNEAPRICRILSQSSFITPDEKDSWVSVGASTPGLKLSGTISLDPSPTKHVQFLSFEIQPLLALESKSILHDEINRLFLNSAFGNEEEGEELDEAEQNKRVKDARYKSDGYTNKELKGGKKGVDRWPMFYINIQQTKCSNISGVVDIDDILDDKSNSLTSIIELLQAMILRFLTKHHFRPKAARGQTFRGEMDMQEDSANEDDPPQPRDRNTVIFTKSPLGKGASLRPARSKKKTPVKFRSTDSDLLGATVKLPSFRHSSSTHESPFDGWSRIKSGAAKPVFGKTSVLSSGQDIQRPSTAPPSVPLVVKSTPPRPPTPLISTSGKVIRQPFEDISAPSSRTKSVPLRPLLAHSSQPKPAMSQPTSTPIDLTQEDGNDIVIWINPITKVKSVVNKRTGHTVPTVNTIASRSSTRSLFSPHLSSRPKLSSSHADPKSSEPTPWLTSLLEKWENPVFPPTESSIPQVSLDGETQQVLHGHRNNCSQLDIDHAFMEASSGIAGRISKAALKNAEVIGQVDRKFILIKIAAPLEKNQPESGKMLVIIDQHAADERIRIENLLAELCTSPPPRSDGMSLESPIMTTYLEKGITFEVSSQDISLLATQKSRFADWGILYDLSTPVPTKLNTTTTIRLELKPKQKLTVRALPPGIAERCKSDPKLLIDLIRTELYSTDKPSFLSTPNSSNTGNPSTWLTKLHICPRGLLDMLNSRACRTAIMFNDVLSMEQGEVLVGRLAETRFPFQCAHGRPSLLPLVELGSVPGGEGVRGGGREGFGREFKRWKVEMRE